MRKLGIGMLSLVGVPGIVFAIAHGMGCSNDGENPALLGIGVKGTKCPDDGNPCTVEDCSAGSLQTVVLTGEEEVDNGPVPECHKWVCVNGAPKTRERDVRAPCALSPKEKGYCTDAQACVECIDDVHCPTGKPVCHNAVCVACVAGGVQRGLETIGKCNEETCIGGILGECASGHCVDGYCCNEACDDTCRACDLAGQLGTCAFVEAPWGDGPCTGEYGCDGAGVCKPKWGTACTKGGECLNNGACLGVCSSRLETCSDDASCNGGTCTFLCRRPKGEDCQKDRDCISLQCNGTCQ